MDREGKIAQMKIVFDAFQKGKPKTMLEVDELVGIMRSNITWYVDEWRALGLIYPCGVRKCKITNHNAMTWTTDQRQIPENPQLNLF